MLDILFLSHTILRDSLSADLLFLVRDHSSMMSQRSTLDNTSIDTVTFAFRASIALNNMAVTMMERRNYRPAYDTLKDAVAAIKMAVPSFTAAESSDTENKRQKILAMLKQANRLISKPHSHHLQCLPPLSSTIAISLNVMSHYARPVSGDGTDFFTLKSSPTKPAMLTLIRVDGTDDVELLETPDSDRTTTIILYNFAVAYLCRAKDAKSRAAAQKLHEAGTKLLVFCRHLLDSQYKAVSNDIFQLPQIIFLSTVLLKALFQALQESGQHEESMTCVSSLESLRSVSAEIDESSKRFFVDCSERAAPAA